MGGRNEIRRTITIAWIHKTQGNPVFDMGQRGAMDRAAELSAHGPVEVRVIPFGPVAADAVAQMQLIESVAVSGVDAIAVSCNDPTACIEPINGAVEAGIPVMTWDSDSPASKRFTFLSIDNYQAGRAAAQLLVDSMGTSGKVALLTGVPGAWNLEERMRGFREAIADYPNIEIVALVPTNEDINLGVQRVEETMQKHPDLNGWFFVGLWPLFAERGSMPLWEEATTRRGLKTVSFDTLPLQLDLLHDGYLAGLVGQKYWGWGADSVQILYDYLINDKRFPSFIDSGMDIVTARNVDAMQRAWQTNDFSQPLPPP
ncbi:MAG: sugar-binding protein [Chloroflexaceae bacterium]|nr:sugar-binding protein [Chloroflexaceae bacterium]